MLSIKGRSIKGISAFSQEKPDQKESIENYLKIKIITFFLNQ